MITQNSARTLFHEYFSNLNMDIATSNNNEDIIPDAKLIIGGINKKKRSGSIEFL